MNQTDELAFPQEFRAGAHLLEVEDLQVEFRTRRGVVHAVNGISLHLDPRETLAILGESGSGKSVSAQAVMGIIDSPPGFVTGGAVRYRGVDLLRLHEEQRRRIRGERLAMVFQDALTALNPVFPVGFQIGEMYRVHRGATRAEARRKAIELLERVRIPWARQRVGDYPHQFSGGMRQRVMIAMALALDPDVLIADERAEPDPPGLVDADRRGDRGGGLPAGGGVDGVAVQPHGEGGLRDAEQHRPGDQASP
jgi:oligopeptide transport system ATP-binding protein